MAGIYTDFEEANMAYAATTLNRKPVAGPNVYDWEILASLGLKEEIQTACIHAYPDGYTDLGLMHMFENALPVYKDLLVEFLASFKMEVPKKKKPKEYNNKKIITFRLMKKTESMSLVEFGVALGLHVGPPPTKKLYLTHLNNASIDTPPGFDMAEFWDELSEVHHNKSNARESHLKSPFFRVLHRCLTWTVLFSNNPEKLNEAHLKGMYYALNQNVRWHLPLAMANMFLAYKEEHKKVLPGGQFVTQIARHLGKFNERVPRNLSPPMEPKVNGALFLVKQQVIVKRPDGTFQLWGVMESQRQGGAGSSSQQERGKRPMHDQGYREAQEFSLQGLYSLVNTSIDLQCMQGEYNDDMAAHVWRADKRAECRYDYPTRPQLPEDYYDNWETPDTWYERTGLKSKAKRQEDGEEDDDEDED